MHELRIDGLKAILFTSSVTEFVQFLNRFQRLQWLLNLMLKSVIGGHNKVVDDFINLLVLKFDSHKSDRLEVMLFASLVLNMSNSCTDFKGRIVCLSSVYNQPLSIIIKL
jgi:hypothetical protein